MPFSNPIYEKLRGWIAIAGLVLGVVAVSLSLYFNSQSVARTQDNLANFTSSSCVRQHQAAEQWDAVLAVFQDIRAKSPVTQTAASNASFDELVTKTRQIYGVFPACAGFKYDPVTKTATTR
jgi:hypothetical protein